MATFVLIAGAWHAGWCWERVRPLLEAKGHRTLAPDLIGTGSGDRNLISVVTLAHWADQISTLISAEGTPVILVGHSRGGIVVSAVAERIPHLIQWSVYLAAYLVSSGETLLSTSNKIPRKEDRPILVTAADGTTEIQPTALKAVFYNCTEDRWVNSAMDRVGPEPMRVFATPLHLTEQRFGSVPRTYIECTQDNAVPIELQREMQKSLPCARVFSLRRDHSPFYSAPDELASCFDALSRSE